MLALASILQVFHPFPQGNTCISLPPNSHRKAVYIYDQGIQTPTNHCNHHDPSCSINHHRCTIISKIHTWYVAVSTCHTGSVGSISFDWEYPLGFDTSSILGIWDLNLLTGSSLQNVFKALWMAALHFSWWTSSGWWKASWNVSGSSTIYGTSSISSVCTDSLKLPFQ